MECQTRCVKGAGIIIELPAAVLANSTEPAAAQPAAAELAAPQPAAAQPAAAQPAAAQQAAAQPAATQSTAAQPAAAKVAAAQAAGNLIKKTDKNVQATKKSNMEGLGIYVIVRFGLIQAWDRNLESPSFPKALQIRREINEDVRFVAKLMSMMYTFL